ncbi:MAG TPA: hypothetical protein VHJ17_17675 [Thermomonospora sp.]|nr:hypothetical protein [Thermomonospora sp.]
MTAVRSVTDGALFTDGRRLLRLALRLDAALTAANGVLYLTLAGPLESLLGLSAGTGRVLGALLLAYAAAVWAVSMPATIRRGAAQAVVELNALYVVLSIAAVATGWLDLNTVGGVWGVLQALVVAGFAAVQYGALRRTR